MVRPVPASRSKIIVSVRVKSLRRSAGEGGWNGPLSERIRSSKMIQSSCPSAPQDQSATSSGDQARTAGRMRSSFLRWQSISPEKYGISTDRAAPP